MIIKVTQDHIDNGTRKKCASCPIALALIEETGATVVSVGSFQIGYKLAAHKIKGPSVIYEGNTPIEADNWLNNFDRGLKVEPFEFTINFHETKRPYTWEEKFVMGATC